MLLHITRTSYQKYSFSYHLRKRMYSNSNLNFLPQQTDGGVNASMSIKAKVRKLQEVMKDNEEEEEEEEKDIGADWTGCPDSCVGSRRLLSRVLNVFL
mmetsp:Transcript_578/g.892  ORF Transcript_578/g.892 Transcript_578/m.892 type:complete len:98 (-) Transcript_578:212-505(-)